MKRLMIQACLLVLSSVANAAPIVQLKPEQVVVRFGNLLWIYGQHGLPQITAAGTAAPLVELCAFFSAHCQWQSGQTRARVVLGNQQATVPVSLFGAQGPYVLLKDAAPLLGFTLAWDNRSRMVNVSRTRHTPNQLSFLQGQAYGFDPQKTTPTQAVSAVSHLGTNGFLTLTVRSSEKATGLTVFARALNGTYVMTGAHVGILGNPRASSPTCLAQTGTCQVTVTDSSAVLAVLSPESQ